MEARQTHLAFRVRWPSTGPVSAKQDGVKAVSQRLIPTDERSGLLTRTAAMKSVSLGEGMKN